MTDTPDTRDPLHTFRAPNPEWAAARATARVLTATTGRPVSVSEVLRAALDVWVADHNRGRLVRHDDEVEGVVGVDPFGVTDEEDGGCVALAYRWSEARGSYARMPRIIRLTAAQTKRLRLTPDSRERLMALWTTPMEHGPDQTRRKTRQRKGQGR